MRTYHQESRGNYSLGKIIDLGMIWVSGMGKKENHELHELNELFGFQGFGRWFGFDDVENGV